MRSPLKVLFLFRLSKYNSKMRKKMILQEMNKASPHPSPLIKYHRTVDRGIGAKAISSG